MNRRRVTQCIIYFVCLQINQGAVQSSKDYAIRFYQPPPKPEPYTSAVECNNNNSSAKCPQRALRSPHASLATAANRNSSSPQASADDVLIARSSRSRSANHAVHRPSDETEPVDDAKHRSRRGHSSGMDSDNRDSGNESGTNVQRRRVGKFRYGLVLDSENRWSSRHEIITGSKSVIGEVFIDGPLSDAVQCRSEEDPEKPSTDEARQTMECRTDAKNKARTVNSGFRSTPGQRDPVLMESQYAYSLSGAVGTPAQASAAAAFFARSVICFHYR